MNYSFEDLIILDLCDEFKNVVSTAFSDNILDVRERNIVEKRLFSEKNCTFDDISPEYGVTRERIRQIKARAYKKIDKYICSHYDSLEEIYNLISRNNKDYITIDDFEVIFDDKLLAKKIMSYFMNDKMSLKNGDIIINKNYGILYFKSNILNLDGKVKATLNLLPDYIFEDDYSSYDYFERRIIDAKYNPFEKGYLKKNIKVCNILEDLLIENFQSGYSIKSDKDYEILRDIYIHKYHDIKRFPKNKRNVSAFFDRIDVCLCDKGMYKSIAYCPLLSDYKELRHEIFKHIRKQKERAKYKGIFDQFKSELIKIGIDNWNYLKGVLDYELPSKYIATKNEIIIGGDAKLNSTEWLREKLKNLNHKFSLSDIKEIDKTISKQEDLLNFYLNEFKNNGLLQLDDKYFIYLDTLNISDNCKNDLRIFINSCLEECEYHFISFNKILNVMMIYNEDLFKQLKLIDNRLIDNRYAFSRLVRLLYVDDYKCTRSLIGYKNVFLPENNIDRIKMIINDKLIISYNDILDFYNKIGLRCYSVNDCTNHFCDILVRINYDMFANKNCFDSKFINKLSDAINSLILNFGTISINYFKDYNKLPKCDFPWTPYLLIGTVRSFFSDKFYIDDNDKCNITLGITNQ